MEDLERYVYLIGSPVIRQVKIGVSGVPTARATTLQTGSPVPLLVILAIPGGPVLERKLHDYFRAYRTHGEWFDFGDENPVTLIVSAATLMGYPVHPKRVAPEDRPRAIDIPDESPDAARFRFLDHLVRAAQRTNHRGFVSKRELYPHLVAVDPAYAQGDDEMEQTYLVRAGLLLATTLKAEEIAVRVVRRQTPDGTRAWGYLLQDLIAAAARARKSKPKRAL
ncbi:GIY-YIG nuclease family protein [Streptomyces collinus]|uniref:GIY-YIG nuclease family protein n=1 Tax=Streptomyces collinus TaxID=42684 RepID=UPI0036BE203F